MLGKYYYYCTSLEQITGQKIGIFFSSCDICVDSRDGHFARPCQMEFGPPKLTTESGGNHNLRLHRHATVYQRLKQIMDQGLGIEVNLFQSLSWKKRHPT